MRTQSVVSVSSCRDSLENGTKRRKVHGTTAEAFSQQFGHGERGLGAPRDCFKFGAVYGYSNSNIVALAKLPKHDACASERRDDDSIESEVAETLDVALGEVGKDM